MLLCAPTLALHPLMFSDQALGFVRCFEILGRNPMVRVTSGSLSVSGSGLYPGHVGGSGHHGELVWPASSLRHFRTTPRFISGAGAVFASPVLLRSVVGHDRHRRRLVVGVNARWRRVSTASGRHRRYGMAGWHSETHGRRRRLSTAKVSTARVIVEGSDCELVAVAAVTTGERTIWMTKPRFRFEQHQ